VFLDEAGFDLQPLSRRTWAPRGQRPVQHGWRRRTRLSVIGSLHVSPRRRLSQRFAIHTHNVRTPEIVRYLRDLHRQLRRPLIVVMDRLPAHRSAVSQLRKQAAAWLHVEWLPGYAPDLNPVEALWSYSKYSRLANFTPDDRDELLDAVVGAVGDVHLDPPLLASFFQSAQLRL
jgi:putative transposase